MNDKAHFQKLIESTCDQLVSQAQASGDPSDPCYAERLSKNFAAVLYQQKLVELQATEQVYEDACDALAKCEGKV